MRIPRKVLAIALAGLFASAAGATDLMQVWQAAARNDRDLVVAGAARAAAEPRREQAASLWRPNVGVSVVAGVGTSESSVRGAQFSAPGFGTSSGVAFDTSVTGATSTRWAVSAAQPLYNPERRVQQQQLRLGADIAELEFALARQGLMLKTAERYFELALAEEHLRVQQMRLEAIQRAFTEAEDRYQLGSIPVTGTHEARASLAGARARVLAAQTELQVRRSQLADSTGLAETMLKAQLPVRDALPGTPRALELWRADADTGNPELRMLRIAADIARAEATKFGVAAAPTLDLIAQASRDRISGSGDFGSASSSATNHILGLKATIPLYTGGYRDAKAEEAARLADKAAAEYERRRQQVAQQVQAVWLGLSAGAGQVQALADGVVAGTARRDATQTGVQVGHRTTQDLLDAESDLASMQLQLSRARVGLLLDELRLELLTGRLDEDRLRIISEKGSIR